MKSKRFLTPVLIIFAVLVLFSCGGVSTPGKSTDTFTFSLDEDALNAIRRSGEGSNSSAPVEYTLTVSLQAVEAGTGYAGEIKTDTKTDPADFFVPTFENIPLNIKLRLSVVVTINDVPAFTAREEEFTLRTFRQKTIRVQMYREKNSPYILNSNLNDHANNTLTVRYDFDPETQADPGDCLFEIGKAGDDYDNNEEKDLILSYDTDSEGNLWYLRQFDTLEGTDAYALMSRQNGSAAANFIILEDIPENGSPVSYKPLAVRYDLQENKIVVFGKSDNKIYVSAHKPNELLDTNGAFYKSGFDALFSESAGAELDFSSLPSDEVTDLLNERPSPLVAVDNGFVYAFRGGMIWKFNYEGAFIKKHHTDVREVLDGNRWNETFQLFNEGTDHFSNYVEDNDFIVYQDKIYLLSHQVQMFHKGNGSISLEDDTAINKADYLYIDRGSIMIGNADTLELDTENIVGLAELKETIELPAYLAGTVSIQDGGTTYNAAVNGVFAFNDKALSQPIWYTLPLTWAASMKDDPTFRNPVKVVAIKDGKLYIADAGTYLYEADDMVTFSDGSTGRGITNQLGLRAATGTRLLAVDLNTHTVTIEDDDMTGYYESAESTGFTLTGTKAFSNGAFYAPTVSYKGNNGTDDEFAASYFSLGDPSGYTLTVEADFGFPQP